MIKVYVSGPYTKGNREENVYRAMKAADVIMNMGMAPFVPHYTHYQDEKFPRPYRDWLNLDFVWLKTCEALLRLPGESYGADKEVELSGMLQIPVFETLTELGDHFGKVAVKEPEYQA